MEKIALRTAALLPALLAALLLSACGPVQPSQPAPRSLPADGPVSVSWEDPAQFSERSRRFGRQAEVGRGEWVIPLAEYLHEQTARRLGDGERLEIHITDIALAGAYEAVPASRAGDIRFYRDIYPPMMNLEFRRLAPDGTVLAEGDRRLRDPGFLTRSTLRHGNDPLRHDKAMIDYWVIREFPPPAR